MAAAGNNSSSTVSMNFADNTMNDKSKTVLYQNLPRENQLAADFMAKKGGTQVSMQDVQSSVAGAQTYKDMSAGAGKTVILNNNMKFFDQFVGGQNDGRSGNFA